MKKTISKTTPKKTSQKSTIVSARDIAAQRTAKAPSPKAKKVKAPKVAPATPVDQPTAQASDPVVVDSRIPPVGTLIEKKDRAGKVRCSCTVLEDGRIEYDGKKFASISAAALAAARDLGLTNKTFNGFVFWGLSKPSRPVVDPVEAINAIGARFLERAKSILAACDAKAQVDAVAALSEHAKKLDGVIRQAS